MGVPLVDLSVQHRQIAAEVAAGWSEVLERTAFVLGEEVAAFEQSFAQFCGTRHCVGVANGTDALELALRALGVGPGDGVVLPANTFIASAVAVARIGAVPVLVDVDPEALLLDPAQLAQRIDIRTRAVMPVHLYGQSAPIEAISAVVGDRGLPIVEDAAQAQGATRDGFRAGSLGTVAATSFYPGKNLGAYGDGGAVLTSDDGIAGRVRRLRNYGSERRNEHPELGFNSRLDTLQAVVLQAKLRRLDTWNGERRDAAKAYDALLADAEQVRLPATLTANEHVWHLYVVRVPRRDEVLARLQEAGVGAAVHYPVPIHLHGAMRPLGHRPGDFPVAEAAAQEILSLPLYPGITEQQQQHVVEVLLEALR